MIFAATKALADIAIKQIEALETRISELEAERDAFKRTLDKRDDQLADARREAETMRHMLWEDSGAPIESSPRELYGRFSWEVVKEMRDG